MKKRTTITIPSIVAVSCAALLAAGRLQAIETREFRAASGGKLKLDLQAGGTVSIAGTGGSEITVKYSLDCTPECNIAFDEGGDGLEVSTKFAEKARSQQSNIELDIRIPRSFDVELDSSGGALTIIGVEGTFTGETAGGEITLRDVQGEAKLTTMGGEITLTDSKLDGSLKTMGGAVLFENVVGDVKGSSMGGNVRYKNVRRPDGKVGSPPSTGDDLDEMTPDTVQISTMGGAITTEDAPEGADVLTMGGNIAIKNARRFVRAKTMGGDIAIDSVDGWVQATTMAGDIDVTLTGNGGDVTLTSMTGDITLRVPPGFGMKLDLEIAYTRNSSKEYRIEAPGDATTTTTVSPEWDYEQGTPRKYIRSSRSVGGGGNTVKIRTINGNITVIEGS